MALGTSIRKPGKTMAKYKSQPDPIESPRNLRINLGANLSTMNKAVKQSEMKSKVVVVVEHDLKEHVLCILDERNLHQCKLNLRIRPGEQIAYRTIGNIPVHLVGNYIDA